jgi:hypothetical protein
MSVTSTSIDVTYDELEGAAGVSSMGAKPNVAPAAPLRDEGRPKSDSPRGRPLGRPFINGLRGNGASGEVEKS